MQHYKSENQEVLIGNSRHRERRATRSSGGRFRGLGALRGRLRLVTDKLCRFNRSMQHPSNLLIR